MTGPLNLLAPLGPLGLVPVLSTWFLAARFHRRAPQVRQREDGSRQENRICHL
jgi:hypothetical protein